MIICTLPYLSSFNLSYRWLSKDPVMRTPPIPEFTFVHIAKVCIELGIAPTPTLRTGAFVPLMAP